MLAYDVAAGGAKDVADEENVHFEILHGVLQVVVKQERYREELRDSSRSG